MSKNKIKQDIRKLIIGLFLIVGIYIYTTFLEEPINSILDKYTVVTDTPDIVNRVVEGNLKVYFLDVGQADSIMIENKDHYMLIDAGNNADGRKLVSFFQSKNIKNFDIVVGTHAHEDHIGGMDEIINNFSIKKFYMPDVITTTRTFEDVILALEYSNVAFDTPKVGGSFNLGDAVFKVIYVGTNEEDLNSTSIVLKMNYGSTSFLFTGDATSDVERQILTKDIAVDVLKVGHHGSKYSSTIDFLKRVNPKYAVIQVGKENDYGHPNRETLSNLANIGAKVYRTDKSGTIVASTDGKEILFTTMETDLDGNRQ